MWAKLDDKLPRHPKVLAAGRRLGGKFGRVRVLGTLADVFCYCAEYFTCGHFPNVAVPQLSDPEPLTVLQALTDVGFLHPAADGYQVHDWDDHNPDATVEKEKRAREAARKREERARRKAAPRLPLNRALSVCMSAGRPPDADPDRPPDVRPMSAVCVRAASSRARTRDPVPSRPVRTDKCRRAPRAPLMLAAIRSRLRAAVHRQLDVEPDTPDSELAAIAKDAAAALRVPYDGREVTKVVDAVRGVRARRKGRAA